MTAPAINWTPINYPLYISKLISLSPTASLSRISFYFAAVAIVCLFFADLEISSPDPWHELGRMGLGLLQPAVWSWVELFKSLLLTLAIAMQGVAIGAVCGFLFALFYRFRVVRLCCAFLRSIHELFWALIFMQVFGLSTLTALLALAIPYSGTLAKIYGELFEEADRAPRETINAGKQTNLSQFFYTVLPLVWPGMMAYTRYRFECGIRSSVVLGFVGLPTVGFYLDTALKQGNYSDAASLFYTLVLVIASLRWWLRVPFVPLYVIAAFLALPPTASVDWILFWQFFTSDLLPAPLKGLSSLSFTEWLWQLTQTQILPGLFNTLVVAQIALVLTGILALAGFPLNSNLFLPVWRKQIGDAVLIVLRTIPEILLSFIGMLLLGPSMIPAVLALGVHNSAIIAHLVGGSSDNIQLRDDAPKGFMRYAYEAIPRVYRQFLAFLFYRWEIIMRETAMLGVLGIPTLGFYIDSAFEALFFDRALLLILISAALTMGADQLAHWLRTRLHLKTAPESL